MTQFVHLHATYNYTDLFMYFFSRGPCFYIQIKKCFGTHAFRYLLCYAMLCQSTFRV